MNIRHPHAFEAGRKGANQRASVCRADVRLNGISWLLFMSKPFFGREYLSRSQRDLFPEVLH